MMDVAPLGSVLLFALVAFSFGVLTYAHVVSDFSVQNVWGNSHSLQLAVIQIAIKKVRQSNSAITQPIASPSIKRKRLHEN